ncbi:serine/threonine-protein kinase [Desulfovibrio cuneatus]|uniref:serine/threonine-protein kinase n=1 Tax=Desulfovibrio cuneatus TaxID=159728 RepID=UPI0003FD8751|nr:serine/threonine-protein kinase [Desulfovibrio cuneatus]
MNTLPLQANDIILDRYEILKYIGAGGMQYVYQARDTKLKRIVALKTPQNASQAIRFKQSAILAARINHHNVAKTFDYFTSPENKEYLIEEYVDGVDLDQMFDGKVRYIDPYLVARLLHYMAKGLSASHHAGVVHRDIKPSNILFINNSSGIEIKITDFGIAKMAESELTEAVERDITVTNSRTVLGAIPFMAPEVIDTPTKVGKEADIWSTGALIFKLLTGEYPFGTGLKAIQNLGISKFPEIPDFVTKNIQYKSIAESIIEIMKRCMKFEPTERLTADELVQQCGKLCYSSNERFIGAIYKSIHTTNGLISTSTYRDVFYHQKNIYGQIAAVGDEVMYAKHEGVPYERAFPVVKLYSK